VLNSWQDTRYEPEYLAMYEPVEKISFGHKERKMQTLLLT
jgi:hypothetical protein